MSPAPTRQRSGPDGRVIAVAIALVVVVAAIAAFVLAGGDDDSDTSTTGGSPEDVALANFGAVRVEGDALPQQQDGGDDAAIGQDGPTIVSEQASGTVEVDPGADGEPTMLVFLAHWCPHCQAELPHYVELAAEGAFDDLRTVAVLTSTDERQPNFPPAAWLDEEGWEGERFFDDREGSAGAAYGLRSFPYTVFLDADGQVVDRFSGEQPTERIMEAVERATA